MTATNDYKDIDAGSPPAKLRSQLPVIRIIYFFYFGAFGVIVTYLNIYYDWIGLSGVEIGLLSSLMPLVAIGAGPLWGMWSDRVGITRPLLVLGSIGMMLAVAGIAAVETYIWFIPFVILYAFFDSAILPIVDSITLRVLGSDRSGYGRVRVWGSLGFIVFASVIGFILQSLGLQTLFIYFIAMMIAVLVSILWLPKQSVAVQRPVLKNITHFIVRKEWLLFSASLLLLGFGNSALYGFLGIYIKDLGGSEGLIGLVFAFATVTELPVMFHSASILRRYDPWNLLVLAYAALALRLLLYGIIQKPGWVIPINLLHSLSFGLYWIAVVAYVDRLAIDEIKASAQGMLYAVLNIARVFGALISGYLFDQVGGARLFQIAALVSVVAIGFLWLNKPKPLSAHTIGGVR